MKNASKKQKGRYLQNLVRDRITKLYPVLGKGDIRTSMMSENGADVKLMSHTARKLFPYSVETKNRQDYKQIYNAFKQAKRHTTLEPLLILKMNREQPIAVLDMEHFFELLQKEYPLN
jgi:hypothetical protein|tara:strand:- start:175 stop:528 length:354 start_codon:yes stop_codon:yes gene_type:complete